MGYYTGQVASYTELLNVLTNNCVSEGWNWSNGVLSKGQIFIGLQVENTGLGQGITAVGYTSALKENPSVDKPFMGAVGITKAVFPVLYHLFIFEKEVYLKIKFSINRVYYLAFGQSTINLPASGLWICANSSYQTSGFPSSHVGLNAQGGCENAQYFCPTPFGYDDGGGLGGRVNSIVLHGFDGVLWSGGTKPATTAKTLNPLFSRLPSSWSAESVLLPINVFLTRLSSKQSLVAQFENARFLRIDNYELEQIITLGNDKWMVFPFYQKNSAARNGGYFIDHSGTFGWAIRYEGL